MGKGKLRFLERATRNYFNYFLYNLSLISFFEFRYIPNYVNAFGNYIESVIGAEKPVFSPRALLVEPTRRCNLNCSICARTELNPIKKRDMSMRLFKETLDKFPKLFKVGFIGWGEPFLNEDIIRMISLARHRVPIVEIYTNGLLLDKNKIEKILRLDITNFWFSVDSVKKRRTGKRTLKRIGDVKNKIIEMVSAKKHMGSRTNILINCSITKSNYDEISEFIREADKLGVDGVYLSDLSGFDRYEMPNRLKLNPQQINHVKSVVNSLDKIQTKVYFRPGKFRIGKFCRMLWTTPFIDAEGNITRCWHRPDYKDHSFGNIKELSSYKEFWCSSKNTQIRKNLKKGKETLCQGCMFRESPIKTIFD